MRKNIALMILALATSVPALASGLCFNLDLTKGLTRQGYNVEECNYAGFNLITVTADTRLKLYVHGNAKCRLMPIYQQNGLTRYRLDYALSIDTPDACNVFMINSQGQTGTANFAAVGS